MRNLILIALVLFTFGSCNKDDDNKRYGVCYCKFVNGEKQEYDLSDLPREEQITECERHSNNAANFGGSCSLE